METYKCFFCEKWGIVEHNYVPNSEAYVKIKEDRKTFFRLYGYIKTLADKIGEKWICSDCRDDLHELISY